MGYSWKDRFSFIRMHSPDLNTTYMLDPASEIDEIPTLLTSAKKLPKLPLIFTARSLALMLLKG